jgi:hypothetical protein
MVMLTELILLGWIGGLFPQVLENPPLISLSLSFPLATPLLIALFIFLSDQVIPTYRSYGNVCHSCIYLD